MKQTMNGNWHNITGLNGMCECGTQNGTCGEQLKKILTLRDQELLKGIEELIDMHINGEVTRKELMADIMKL